MTAPSSNIRGLPEIRKYTHPEAQFPGALPPHVAMGHRVAVVAQPSISPVSSVTVRPLSDSRQMSHTSSNSYTPPVYVPSSGATVIQKPVKTVPQQTVIYELKDKR